MMKNYFKKFSIIVILLFASYSYGQYCEPTIPMSTTSYINNFKVSTAGTSTGDFLNHASANVGYENITDSDFTLISGTNYGFNIGVGDGASTTHKRVHVWIDMNGDKDFDDAGELIFSYAGGNTSGDLGFGSKGIGVVQKEGITRMRVALVAADGAISAINPCDDFTGGEVQDYKVNLLLTEPAPEYCEPTIPMSTTSYINNFKVSTAGTSTGDFLNHASANVGYENITDSDFTLISGTNYGFNIGVGDGASTTHKRVHVWIDMNGDKDFDDAGELIFSYAGGNTSGDLGFGSKGIGVVQKEGITRMRVALVAADGAISAINPCDDFTGGEVQDYKVNLLLTEPAPEYCEPTIPMSTTSYINNFKVSTAGTSTGDFLNHASANVGYENITDSDFTLISGTNYGFNIGVGDGASTTHKRVHVWIDMNGDKDFDDAGELIFSYAGGNTSGDLGFGSKGIGVVQKEGITRMRVALVAADGAISAINPCDDFTGGEVQDYKVNLLLTEPAPEYCEPTIPMSTTSYINNFKVSTAGTSTGDFLNHASANVGYENITDSDFTLISGTNYGFNIGVGDGASTTHKRVHVWIDMNGDKDFDDAGELIFSYAGGNTSGDLGFGSKGIGVVQKEGITRMRVALVAADGAISAINPCDDFTGGEVQDYKVNLLLTEPAPEYCEPTIPMSTTSYINNFKVSTAGTSTGDFLNHASANVGYENITDSDFTLISGTNYGFNIGVGDGASTTHKRVHVWIDMNGDKDFDDAGELIFSYAGGNTSGDLGFGSKGIGVVQKEGITRMRVALVAADGAISAINPCDDFTGGEVQDYKVNLLLTEPAPEYCEPTIPMSTTSYINNFKVSTAGTSTGDFLNHASANVGYENITDSDFTLISGTNYGFNIGVGDGASTTHKRVHVWIDMNGDKDFDDAGELIFSYAGGNTSGDLGFGSKGIGVVQKEGITRMRVALVAADGAISAINPCDDFTGGEVQDYKVNLLLTELAPEYCEPTVPMTASSYINNFKVSGADGDIINRASTNVGYENITDSDISLKSDTAYRFDIGVGDAATTTHKRVHVWIDMNGDKDFDDAGELIFSWAGANTGGNLGFSGKNIGSVVTAGESRMRIAMLAADAEIDAVGPCDDFTGGEVQDYKIMLIAGEAVSCDVSSMTASTTSFLDYMKISQSGDGDKLNHTSGNDGYINITDNNTTLNASTSYRFNFGVGNPAAASNKRVHIWIDKNKDGDFADGGEDIFNWTGGNTTEDLQFSGKTIGDFTTYGTYTMRVALRSSDDAIPAINPCETFTDGEFEDYQITIEAPIPPLELMTPEVDLDLFVGDGIAASVNGTPHTYRIPSLVTTKDGTLLAVTDARYENASDVPGVIDMFVRRSTDNGATWDNPITIKTDHGGDACTVVDKTTGRIFVFYAYSEFSTIFQSNGDPSNPATLRSQYKYSDDDGLTWSAAIDLTADLYRPSVEKSFWASAGTGIQLRNGTLVIPIAVVRNDNKIFGSLLYSTDNGATWNRSQNNSFINFDENTIVELNDGRIMINARNHYGTGTRLVTYTDDLGTTWEDYTFDDTLVDPISQGNILRYTSTLDGFDKDRILFSNSGNSGSRVDGTMRISYDEGQTWAHSKLYQSGFSAYSSMAILPDGKIGVLYETNGYKTIRFRKFSLEALTDSSDTYVLGVDDLTSDKGVSLYPNPMENKLNIKTSITSEVSIYNVVGKLVLRNKVRENNKELDVSHLKRGVYIVRIKNDLGVKNSKIIKN
ncbi:GEVED domain-containing protein [Polaribacter ponticola]|uniref:exo-alpha-sialidase n=1 Tax=Polaribacter ponticola TaxID=2978475 RepID=A0ABT5SB34_9FLAO|nr:GEVED domain-containing protein [Polaribacter sp. MSW5]MDD7915293.1 GEVED domain-containing protein [Polaribacter sp. MSW5]